jgi:hypothetical protein
MIGMLYQASSTQEIEITLENGIKTFVKKYGIKPDSISVNPKIEIKVYDGVPLVKDNYMYTTGLILMNTSKRITPND